MLTLTRRAGQRLLIGDDIVIIIDRIYAGSVSVKIRAPDDVLILREELADRDNLAPTTDPAGDRLADKHTSPPGGAN